MANRSTRIRLIVFVLATVAIFAPLAWLWQSSLVGNSYSVMAMGTLDYGVVRLLIMTMVRPTLHH